MAATGRSVATSVLAVLLLWLTAFGCGPMDGGGSGRLDCDHLDRDGDEDDDPDDFEPEANSSFPHYFVVVGDALFFQATHPDGNVAVWRYDGRNKPQVVEDLRLAGVEPGRWPAAFNGFYYFRGTQDDDTELWRTDGTTSERVLDLRPGPLSGEVRDLTVFQDDLYFSGFDGVHGREMWRIDADDNPFLVRDFGAGSYSGAPGQFVVFENQLIFGIQIPFAPGSELWRHDGAEQHRLASGLLMANTAELNGKLYFGAFDRRDQRQGLYVYDGEASPEKLEDFGIGGIQSFGNNLIFTTVENSRSTLWSWDTVNAMEALYVSAFADNVQLLPQLDQTVYFANSEMLWQYDGTGPPRAVAPWSDPAVIPEAVIFDGRLLYTRATERAGSELWAFDGEEDERIADLFPGDHCKLVSW